MPATPTPHISKRKSPKQSRAKVAVSAILEAAIQVLQRDGIQKFTTARVAEKAGVSVGSLYQYFPNKAAILFQLQKDEWIYTSQLLHKILADRNLSPFERLHKATRAFIQSECDEAQLRTALKDAAPLYRHSDEAQEARAESQIKLDDFLLEILPNQSTATRQLAGEMILRTLTSFGKQFSETIQNAENISLFSQEVADMLKAYLQQIANREN